MRWLLPLAVLSVAALCGPAWARSGPGERADDYADAIRRVNEAHARKPGETREQDLAKRLPKAASRALDGLLTAEPADGLADALVVAGEAALDLDLVADFERIRERLAEVAPERSAALGVVVSRPRFLVRGIGGLSADYVETVADVFEAVLAGYDEVFGFAEWSKVPGKKLRLRLHKVERITRPPHFAPQFPFHSEIDFPVADAERFASPTPDGKFLFYGLCHELGHVIAMWGDRGNEEDHHAWAHYTGVVLVEHLARSAKKKPFMKPLRDVRWRSPEVDRKRLEKDGVEPSTESRDGVLALLFALHDAVGPEALGAAINHLDAKGRSLRINHVRYYTFEELREALLATLKSKKHEAAVKRLL